VPGHAWRKKDISALAVNQFSLSVSGNPVFNIRNAALSIASNNAPPDIKPYLLY
jgi:hypothetical protein